MNEDGPFLGRNWQRAKVLRYLKTGQGQKLQLVWFLRERHYERFFEPIKCLFQADENEMGFGFSIMSLCCLLIETIECYRLGWPSSSARELRQLEVSPNNLVVPSLEYKLIGPFASEVFSSERAFINFFDEPQHRVHFPDLFGKGQEFYKSIRCGLLHQAQTKDGWRIRTSGKCYDDRPDKKSVNRYEFAQALQNCFDSFLNQLENVEWDDPLWISARRKIYWLAVTS